MLWKVEKLAKFMLWKAENSRILCFGKQKILSGCLGCCIDFWDMVFQIHGFNSTILAKFMDSIPRFLKNIWIIFHDFLKICGLYSKILYFCNDKTT